MTDPYALDRFMQFRDILTGSQPAARLAAEAPNVANGQLG